MPRGDARGKEKARSRLRGQEVETKEEIPENISVRRKGGN